MGTTEPDIWENFLDWVANKEAELKARLKTTYDKQPKKWDIDG